MKENQSSRWNRPSLLLQVLIGAVLGMIVGQFIPSIGSSMEILGALFLNLIQMVIVPLIFPLVVLAIVRIDNTKRFGSEALKAFGLFFLITTLLIIVGLLVGQWTGIGSSVQADQVGTEAIEGIASDIRFDEFFLSLVPSNILASLSAGNLLPVVFFGIFLGTALISIGKDAAPVVTLFESWTKAMYKMVNYAIAFAPIGVFGVLASDVAEGGLGSLFSLGQFILLLFALYIGAVVIVFPIIGLLFGVPYIALLKSIKDLILLAFTTGSSSVVMPSLIERLEKNGVPTSIAAFVTPLGYSFNLTGACLYISLSVMFVSNLYGTQLGWDQILTLTIFLTVISKGIAAVPSGALVVLLAAAGQLGLPAEGVALLVSVDFFANAGRTAVNVIGNALIPAIIGGWKKNNIKKELSENRNY